MFHFGFADYIIKNWGQTNINIFINKMIDKIKENVLNN